MTIIEKPYGHEIYADEGKAIRHKDDPQTKTTMTSVCIPLVQSPDEWRDCEYGDDDQPSPDEPTIADKDEALRRFGVEV